LKYGGGGVAWKKQVCTAMLLLTSDSSAINGCNYLLVNLLLLGGYYGQTWVATQVLSWYLQPVYQYNT
jgi:hypothetical protein